MFAAGPFSCFKSLFCTCGRAQKSARPINCGPGSHVPFT